MNVFKRNNVKVQGSGKQTMIFAHGFGCDQNMWRLVAPAFQRHFKTILFDNVGAGGSDLTAFDSDKYASLQGYAQDIVEILEAVGEDNTVFVGHSVSAMVGILAAIERPELFAKLILVGPSPCYLNDGEYIGGFDRTDIEDMLEFLDINYLGWSSTMAPAIMGNPDESSLAVELENSFCRTDPAVASHFARTTFLSDHRQDLRKLKRPSLILQCSDDVIAPDTIGRFMHSQMPDSTLVQMKATGHCPNLSAPDETTAEIRKYLQAS